MKIKILLSIVILNIICLGIFLVIRPATVEAETKGKAQQKQLQAQPQAPVPMEPGAQVDMLRQREEQVKAREMEMRELERQVTEKIKKLEAIEASLKIELEAYKVVAGERVKQLVKIYSTMKPKAAATLMNNLDQDVAVQVILGMKGDIAGGILSYMDPQKAAGISQRLMYFRTGIGAPSIAPAAPAPAAEKAPAEQKTSEISAPPAEPAVSVNADKPSAVVKIRPAKKAPAVVKAAVQPKPAIVAVVKPASEPAAASAPASAPMTASTPAPAVTTPAPAPASAPALASAPTAENSTE